MTTPANTEQNQNANAAPATFPSIFNSWLQTNEGNRECLPRRVTKKFHGEEITGWTGRVNYKDVEGYAENKRLKIYLNRWRNRRGDMAAAPTTKDMYEIMLEADAEEADDKKVFELDRLAQSIVRNG